MRLKTAGLCKHPLLAAFALLLTLTSCSETIESVISDYSPSLTKQSMTIQPQDLNFGAEGGTKNILINSPSEWTINAFPSWISVVLDALEKENVYIEVEPNESFSSRVAVLQFNSKTLEGNHTFRKNITVSQEAAIPSFQFLNIENTNVSVAGTANTLTIDVQTNIDDLTPEVTSKYGTADWLTASYADKQLTIAISDNNTEYVRYGSVKLWSETHSKGGSIEITQAPANLSFNDITSLSFDAEGGSKNVKISSELPWWATSKQEWIEISPTAGYVGDTQIQIKVLPSFRSDARNGYALFLYEGNPVAVGRIPISQSGRYINVSPSSISLSADRNLSETIDIQSNIGWEVDSYPDWLSFEPMNGPSGNSAITIIASKNNSLNSRSGTIVLKDSETGGIESLISVTQEGLNFDGKTMEFGWEEKARRLSVPMESWDAAVSAGWISLSKYSGGPEDITVSIARNEDEDPRTGSIIFTSEGKAYTINVIQEGQYLKIDNTSGEISAMGGNIEFSIATSVGQTWSVEYEGESKDWISVKEIFSADVNHADYTLGIAYNNSINARNADFVITPTMSDVTSQNAAGVKYRIKQAGRQLSADVSKIYLLATGGTSETYNIVADGEYSISKSNEDNWFSIVNNADARTFYIVSTENNTEQSRESSILINLTGLPNNEEKQLNIQVYQLSKGEFSIIIDENNNTVIW